MYFGFWCRFKVDCLLFVFFSSERSDCMADLRSCASQNSRAKRGSFVVQEAGTSWTKAKKFSLSADPKPTATLRVHVRN